MSNSNQIPEPKFSPAVALPVIPPSETEQSAIAGMNFSTPEQIATNVKRLEDETRDRGREPEISSSVPPAVAQTLLELKNLRQQ